MTVWLSEDTLSKYLCSANSIKNKQSNKQKNNRKKNVYGKMVSINGIYGKIQL